LASKDILTASLRANISTIQRPPSSATSEVSLSEDEPDQERASTGGEAPRQERILINLPAKGMKTQVAEGME
jgi:hypothetical protein